MMRTALILDMSYTLKMVKEKQLDAALVSRALGGYFSRVISVHPLAALFDQGAERFGSPRFTHLDDSHVFIEGTIGASKALRFLPPLNFLIAQIRLIRAVLAIARNGGVDVIRVGDPYYLGLLGVLLARRLDAPLAIRVCARYDEIVKASGRPVMPRLFGFRWLEKRIERFVFRRCDLIAGANEDNMRYALENGGREEFATVFRYGNLIHPDHWKEPALRDSAADVLSELGLGDHVFVATVARLDRMKLVEHTIRAFAEVVRGGRRIKALIIGGGPIREEMEALAKELNVGDAVIFAGERPQEWIARVLPRASVVVSPQMGRALTEAALAAVPIAAYDYDWQREVVVDGETGYLARHKDWNALAEKIALLLAEPDRAKEMGRNARRKVLEMMDPQMLELHERSEYSKLLERFSKGRNRIAPRV